MTFVNRKHYRKVYTIFFLFLLNNCQLSEPKNQHGINFLENREKTLIIGKTNQNDIVRIIGYPHSKSIKDENKWIYFERTITRGKMIKLGQNVLKTNNVLVLSFNKYGVLSEKQFLNKDDIKKLSFSKEITENNLTKRSFVQSFLSSIKSKMYGNK